MGTGGTLHHLGAAAVFAGFVLLACWAGLRRPDAGAPAAAQRRVSVLIAWALLASFAAGLAQRELFPFAHWQLLANRIAPVRHAPLVTVRDAAGAEHRVDYRAYDPLSYAELMAYLDRTFLALPPDGRDRVAAYLLGLVNGARERVLAGEDIRPGGRLLGPLRAPYFSLSPARWRDRRDVPAAPLVELRFSVELWEIERRRDSTGVDTQLRYAGPRP